MTVTRDQFLSKAEVVLAVTMQEPAEINKPPLCRRLDVPCEDSGRTLPDFGAALSVAEYLNRSFAVVAEGGIFANKWNSSQTNQVRSTLGGVRARTPLIEDGPDNTGRFFAQLLAGRQWSTAVPGRFALQPGAGGEAYLHTGLIIHVEYDYCWATGHGRNLSTGRVLAGIGIPIGERD